MGHGIYEPHDVALWKALLDSELDSEDAIKIWEKYCDNMNYD